MFAHKRHKVRIVILSKAKDLLSLVGKIRFYTFTTGG
jgi:hypothetical protein